MDNNNGSFWEIQRLLSGEFSKYVLAHPEIDSQIPDGAEIIFQLKGEPTFNVWSKEVSKQLHESKRPVVIVEIEGILPPLDSRLINPHIEVATF